MSLIFNLFEVKPGHKWNPRGEQRSNTRKRGVKTNRNENLVKKMENNSKGKGRIFRGKERFSGTRKSNTRSSNREQMEGNQLEKGKEKEGHERYRRRVFIGGVWYDFRGCYYNECDN